MSLQCVLRSAVASFTLLPCVRIKLQCISRLERKGMRETEFIVHNKTVGKRTLIEQRWLKCLKLQQRSKTIHEMEKGQAKTPKKKTEKTIITYRRISKRLAIETTFLYCSCSITPSRNSCSSLLKSTHAIPYHLRRDAC